MQDDYVTNKRGIYEYILTDNKKYLNIRVFNDVQIRKAYERQEGVCLHCKKKFELTQMEADHIIAWSRGGKTDTDNCQMLCVNCNRSKGEK
jgi:5-methylcytosine-specific restriction endonuclease McrA